MAFQTNQVRCPFCNGAMPSAGTGNYTCDYCLQPFTAVDAQREESRLREQVEGWLQQKMGALGGVGAASVDASSRAFIFQQKVFPELRRDVDRVLESLAGVNQHALVLPPLPARADAPHPLFQARGLVSSLKELRARVASDSVSTFALSSTDRDALSDLDARLAEVLNSYHTVSGGHAGTAAGYAAARRSLERLIDETDQIIQRLGSARTARREFLGIQKERFSALCELCRALEQIVGGTSVVGVVVGPQLEKLAQQLDALLPRLEASPWNSSDTMPTLVAVRSEADGARAMARWLLAYDSYIANRPISFPAFRLEAERQLEGLGPHLDEAVGPWTEGLRAAARWTPWGSLSDSSTH